MKCMQPFTTYDTESPWCIDVICDAWGLDLLHHAPDNVLTQTITHVWTECKDHCISASPIWFNVDWHLVWLSEHLTKLKHLHKLPLNWGFTITSGGLPIFSQLQINLGMKGDMCYTEMYYTELKRHTRVPLPFEFIGKWLLALASCRARRKWLALQSAGQRACNESKSRLNVKQTFIK